MSELLKKIESFLNESTTVLVDQMTVSGKVRGKRKVGVGDVVEFKDGSKPVKGKNSYNTKGGEIEKIKGNTVYINNHEEGSFWMSIDDLYWEIDG